MIILVVSCQDGVDQTTIARSRAISRRMAWRSHVRPCGTSATNATAASATAEGGSSYDAGRGPRGAGRRGSQPTVSPVSEYTHIPLSVPGTYRLAPAHHPPVSLLL